MSKLGKAQQWFGKRVRDLSPEETLLYNQMIMDEKRKPDFVPFKNSMLHQLFGNVKHADLTPEQKREYQKYTKIQRELLGNYHGAISLKMFGKSVRDLNDEEIVIYNRYIKTGQYDIEINGHDESRVRQEFGKKVKELSSKESSKYSFDSVVNSGLGRKSHDESRVRQTFGKPIKELNDEEISEYYKAILIGSGVPHHLSIVRQMFGKKFNDLTKDQKKIYLKYKRDEIIKRNKGS